MIGQNAQLLVPEDKFVVSFALVAVEDILRTLLVKEQNLSRRGSAETNASLRGILVIGIRSALISCMCNCSFSSQRTKKILFNLQGVFVLNCSIRLLVLNFKVFTLFLFIYFGCFSALVTAHNLQGYKDAQYYALTLMMCQR